jgi:proteasome lid subunit RPN8/RPN11
MNIWLTDEQVRTIATHALTSRPYEACGIIGGIDNRVTQVIPAPNTATDPYHHYHIDDRTLTDAMFRLQRAGMTIVGFYHSHPDGSCRPSPSDIHQANYPHTAYIIIGLAEGWLQMAAWEMNRGEVTPVEIHIGLGPEQIEDNQHSNAQKNALLASAIISFIFMIVLSLSLLPPAPPIP